MKALLESLKGCDFFSDDPQEVIAEYLLPHRQVQEYRKGSYSLIASLRTGEILGADLIFTRSQLSPYHAVTAADTKIVYLPADLATQPGQLRSQQRFRGFPGRATACTPNINAHPFFSSVTFGNYSKSLQKSNRCSK